MIQWIAACAASLATMLLIPDPAAALRRGALPAARRRHPWVAPRRLAAGFLGAIFGAVAVGGWLGGLLGGLAGWVVVIAIARSGRPDRATALLAEQLPEALDFLAVCLEAGLPIARAVATVSAVSPPATRDLLDEVATRLALGSAGELAWASLRLHPCWGRAAADIARAQRSGTALTGVLRMHADDARRQARDLAAKRARTVGVRSVIPLVACFLPAFVLVGVVPIVAGLLAGFLG